MAIQPNDRVTGTSSYTDTGVSSAGFDRTSAGNGATTGDESLRGRSREVASQVKERASEVVGQYSERAKTGIEEQKHRAAQELSNVANALRSCGTDLQSGEESMLAPYVGRVADEVNRLSNLLDSRSVDDIARDVEGFARRNPAVFLGACFGVGILAARFLKSHKPQLPAPYVGYGEATYTETGYESFGSDHGGAIGNDVSSNVGPRYDETGTYTGGGAAYSGEFRGTSARTSEGSYGTENR